MFTQELTLFTIAGKRCPIFTLPERPPFMLASDLAEVYGTSARAINQAVKRNPTRFPPDFVFDLTAEETAHLKSQNVTSNMANRAFLTAFTHGGANALSGVLRTPVADAMSVEVHRAFTEMERRAFAEVRFMLQKLRCDATCNKPIYNWVLRAEREDWTFEYLFGATNYTRKRLEAAVKELVAMGILAQPLRGMQGGLFANV